ncbi:MAG: SOS response-associated peptidase family protein [Methylibium sp.]|nr:SOS response-associated peptidase family protein [Methylibium sp.]
MQAAFQGHEPADEDERRIRTLIEEFASEQASKLEQELFAQRKRLADAERALEAKPTKAAAESKRIATDKIYRAMTRLSDPKRAEPKEQDSRIFPGIYAPVIVMEGGRRVVKPMRYQCRPPGKPAFYDTKYPGTYNARRDNLEGFWKNLFGFSNGLMVVNAFYENVNRHRLEGRGLGAGEAVENVVLEFKPNPPQAMLVACLWSHWKRDGEPELLSFAAITDEPPPETRRRSATDCARRTASPST